MALFAEPGPNAARRAALALVATLAFLWSTIDAAAQSSGITAGEEFHSSGGGRQCGYPGYSYDMSKVEEVARGYPNGRIFIVTPQEKSRLEDEILAWNQRGGQPIRAMAPCFNCSQEYEACIVFDRGGNRTPGGDEFASSGGGSQTPPGNDQFGSGGGTVPGGTNDNACLPDYANTDKPGLSPEMHYMLGFSQSARKCIADTATLQNLALGVAAARFKQVAAILLVVAAPGVLDAAIHPPGYSKNPDPYRQGREEGKNLCEWGLKVSPALVARCGLKPKTPPPSKPLSALSVALADLGWLKKINPTRNTENCGLTVLAVDEALAGRGTLPAPPTSCAGTNTRQLEGHYNQTFGSPGAHADVNNTIFHAGDGARGIVFAKAAGGGHYFNIVNHGGDVMLLDGQLGQPMTWGAYREMGFYEFSLLRTN